MRLLGGYGLGCSLQVSSKRNGIHVAPCVPHANPSLLPEKVPGVDHPYCVGAFALVSTCSSERTVVQT